MHTINMVGQDLNVFLSKAQPEKVKCFRWDISSLSHFNSFFCAHDMVGKGNKSNNGSVD